MHEDLAYLVGCHMGCYVSYDINNYYGPWRMYMRIRVALNVNEPLKRCMVFEKEDGIDVNLSFKYEKLGVFCYCCGILGHTDQYCPKRQEPGFVDGVKLWGKFLNPSNRSVGGGVTVNKWLRGGRMDGRGGRTDGGRDSGNSNGVADANDGPFNVVVMGPSSEHSLFGRVNIIRGRGFTFHRLVTSVIGPNGGGEGQWVRFNLNNKNIQNQVTIRRLVNGMAAAIARGAPASSLNINANPTHQQTTLMLTGNPGNNSTGNDGKLRLTGCNQVTSSEISITDEALLNESDVGQTSEPGRVVCASKKKPVMTRCMADGPLVIRDGPCELQAVQTQDIQCEGKGKAKEVSGPAVKKRFRPSTTQADNVSMVGVLEQEASDMVLEYVNEGSAAKVNSVTLQNNPLFTKTIVMAEAEIQPRQQP